MNKNWKKISVEKKLQFTWYLTLGLHKGRPSYRRSLQLLKEISEFFSTFLGHFWSPGSGSTDGSGSETLVSTLLEGLPVWSWWRGLSRVGWAWTWGPGSPGVTHPRSPPPLSHGSSARYLVGEREGSIFPLLKKQCVVSRYVTFYHCSGYRTFWPVVGFRNNHSGSGYKPGIDILKRKKQFG